MSGHRLLAKLEGSEAGLSGSVRLNISVKTEAYHGIRLWTDRQKQNPGKLASNVQVRKESSHRAVNHYIV